MQDEEDQTLADEIDGMSKANTVRAIHTPGRYFQKPGIWTHVFWQHAQVPRYNFG